MLLSDAYLFHVKGDRMLTLRMIRPGVTTDGIMHPRLVLAAVKGSGGYRLWFLCGRNLEHDDKPCVEYPREVDQVWVKYNACNFKDINVCDAAADLLSNGVIREYVMDEDGSINTPKSQEAQKRNEEEEMAKKAYKAYKYIVLCTDHGDSCDGHATRIGKANTREEAQKIIDEDKQIFIDNCKEGYDDGFDKDSIRNDKPLEIWYGSELDDNGRIYDVIEI